tara:strand:+ start:7626 stop:8840 length:1215 start_codon:yes stop_codon:yes gene_type:complete
MNFFKIDKIVPIVYQSIGRVSVQVLGFILGILIVRYSGLELFGEYSKYNALINISFGVFASGVYNHYLRSNNINLLWESLIGTTYILFFFLIFIFPIYAFLFNDSYLDIFLISLGIYFMRLTEVYIISTRFIEKDIKSILPRTLPYLILIILFFVFKPDNISSLLLIFFLSWSVTLFYIYSLKAYIKIQILNIKSLFSSTLILSLTTLSTQIYANFDQLMISELLGDNKLGLYKIGLSFSVLVIPLIGVFAFVYLSTLKEKLKKDSIELIKKSFYKQIKINFFISFTFVICCLIFLDSIIELVYGIDEKDSYYVGVIMSTGVIFNVVSMVFSYTFLAIKKDREILIITLIGGLINIILNYFLITNYDILGAAWASLITQLLILVLFIYVFYFRINFFKTVKKIN